MIKFWQWTGLPERNGLIKSGEVGITMSLFPAPPNSQDISIKILIQCWDYIQFFRQNWMKLESFAICLKVSPHPKYICSLKFLYSMYIQWLCWRLNSERLLPLRSLLTNARAKMTWLLTTLTPLLKTGMEAVLENWSGSFQDYSSQSCHFCFLSLEVGHFFIPFPFCYEPLFVYLWIFWGKHLLLRGQFQHLPPELSSQWLILVGWLCISWSHPVCSLSTPQYDLAPPWNPPKIDTQTTQSSPVSSSPPPPPSPAPVTHSSTLLCNISFFFSPTFSNYTSPQE